MGPSGLGVGGGKPRAMCDSEERGPGAGTGGGAPAGTALEKAQAHWEEFKNASVEDHKK